MRKSNQTIAKVFQPPSQLNWTDDKLATLSDEQLLNLFQNLKTQREAGRVTEEAADDLSRRIAERLPAKALVVRRKRLYSHVVLEEDVALQLRGLAMVLSERYDLSAETAQQHSADTKGFKPQTLMDKRGEAKTSAAVKDGRMAIDRFISYRVRDSLASLAFLLFPDQPNESGRFVLLATDDLLDAETPSEELAARAREQGWSEGSRARMRALPIADFAEAKQRFEALIASMATKLPEARAEATFAAS